MFNRHYLPKFKWDLVDRIYDLHDGKYSRLEINKKPRRELLGWYVQQMNKRMRNV